MHCSAATNQTSATALNAKDIATVKNSPAPTTHRRQIMLRVYSALSMLRDGTATREEWADCADALNIVEELGNMGKLPKIEIVDRAQAYMVLAMDNYRNTGKMTMQRDGCELMAQIAGEYDAALGRFSRQTMAQASSNVIVRIAQGRSAGVVVVE